MTNQDDDNEKSRLSPAGRWWGLVWFVGILAFLIFAGYVTPRSDGPPRWQPCPDGFAHNHEGLCQLETMIKH
jgi:hypothetical protein